MTADPNMHHVQLRVENINIGYNNKSVVENISFQLNSGEIACLLGPSGCGKTTILRAIAGFEPVMHGQIVLNGNTVSSPALLLPPEQRHIGMVFQDFALFPHLSVSKNIQFGLKKLPKAQQKQRVNELLELINLSHAKDKYPHQLSGGQQQRVALARAMAPRPNILLLDEPFSSMDLEMRMQLAHEVRDLLRSDNMTAIMVTHDQYEAFAIADHIGVIGGGKLRQWGSAYDLYHRPTDRFVADFIGEGVFIPGKLLQTNEIETELGIIKGNVIFSSQPTKQLSLLIRPDDVVHDDNSPLKAEIIAKDFRGPVYLYTVKLQSGQLLMCLVQSHHDHDVGGWLGIRLEADHLAVFPDSA